MDNIKLDDAECLKNDKKKNNLEKKKIINNKPLPNLTGYEYPVSLYLLELRQHEKTFKDYQEELLNYIIKNSHNKINIEVYKQQPYLNPLIRTQLLDFLLKMSIKMRTVSFVFFKAVKLFDKYCSKRIVLLDQSYLIIFTCLWIANKVQGGNNNHFNFKNFENLKKQNSNSKNTGFFGSRCYGSTQSPKSYKITHFYNLLCKKKKYGISVYKQMEFHILTVLNWKVNDPSVEDFIISSLEFNTISTLNSSEFNLSEFLKIKEFLSYASLYSWELVNVSFVHLSKVILDLINECFDLNLSNFYYQESEVLKYSSQMSYNVMEPNSDTHDKYLSMDLEKYNFIKTHLINSVLNSTQLMRTVFTTVGPQYLHYKLSSKYKFSTRKGKMSTPLAPININTLTQISSSNKNIKSS